MKPASKDVELDERSTSTRKQRIGNEQKEKPTSDFLSALRRPIFRDLVIRQLAVPTLIRLKFVNHEMDSLTDQFIQPVDSDFKNILQSVKEDHSELKETIEENRNRWRDHLALNAQLRHQRITDNFARYEKIYSENVANIAVNDLRGNFMAFENYKKKLIMLDISKEEEFVNKYRSDAMWIYSI